MIRKNISALIFATAFLLAPSASEAYTPYDITVISLSEAAALYEISFNLGNQSRDITVPISTQRANSETATSPSEVGFTFTASEGGDSNAGEATGLVYSNASVIDGMYHVPAGTGASFTLFVILKLEKEDPRAKYGLQVTSLPFGLGDQQNGLNIHELSNYKTKQIGLNK